MCISDLCLVVQCFAQIDRDCPQFNLRAFKALIVPFNNNWFKVVQWNLEEIEDRRDQFYVEIN